MQPGFSFTDCNSHQYLGTLSHYKEMLAVATTHPNHYTTLLKSAEWDSRFSLTIFKLTESQQVMSLKKG